MQNNESGSKVKKKKKKERKPYHLQAQTHKHKQWTKQRKENKVEGMSFPKSNHLPVLSIRITKG